tara:strand:- start:15 stop:293 length:279 start_codon:yes stop_codon:yes gene_type:complete
MIDDNIENTRGIGTHVWRVTRSTTYFSRDIDVAGDLDLGGFCETLDQYGCYFKIIHSHGGGNPIVKIIAPNAAALEAFMVEYENGAASKHFV